MGGDSEVCFHISRARKIGSKKKVSFNIGATVFVPNDSCAHRAPASLPFGHPSLIGDWRTLPTNAWSSIYKQFGAGIPDIKEKEQILNKGNASSASQDVHMHITSSLEECKYS